MMKEKVLVIGAGVIGLSIALRLKKEGYSVTVIASSDPWQASAASAGVLFPTSGARASGEPGVYNMKALSLWDNFEAELGGIVAHRGIMMFGDGSELESLQEIGEATGLRVNYLKEGSSLFPSEQKPLYSLEINQGRVVDPRKLIRVLWRSLYKDIIVDRAKRLLLSGERVVGVEGKDKYRAKHTVLALGALGYDWIEEGLRPHVVPLIGEALLLERSEALKDLPAALYPPGESSGPLLNYGEGIMWWGGSYRRDEYIGARWSEIERIINRARELFPWVSELIIRKVLFGVRPISPDGLPFVGPSKRDGLYIATGHGRDGILQAPLAAEQVLSALGGEIDERLLPERRLEF